MKKNLRSIPPAILAKIKSSRKDKFVAGCAAKFRAEDLASGALEHLGIRLATQGLEISAPGVPPADRGKFSSANVDGLEIVRKDLPKETRTRSVETPNWGDSRYGTHTVDLRYERYPREFRAPRELIISARCENAKAGLPTYIIAFRVDEVLDAGRKDFKEKLFENLNLLQENVGACGVEPAEVSLSEYSKSLHVAWDILPPGTKAETLERLFRGRSPSQEERDVAGERHDFFSSLKPQRLVFGTNGLRRYFGALLEDDLVVFENIQYGNAVYILFKKWEDLSRKSRLELLSGKYEEDFVRVPHVTGWKGKVRAVVAEKRTRNSGNN